MGQFDHLIKRGNSNRPSVVEPSTNPITGNTQPGFVVPAKLIRTDKEGTETEIIPSEEELNGGKPLQTPRKRSSRSMLADLRSPRPKRTESEPRKELSGETWTPSEDIVSTPKPSEPVKPVKQPKFQKLNGVYPGRIYDAKTGSVGISKKQRIEEEISSKYKMGSTVSKENKTTNIYNADGTLKPEYNDPTNVHSTTIHEHNGEYVEGGVRKAKYNKPKVVKKGAVVPSRVLESYGSQEVKDVKAAQKAKDLEAKNSIPSEAVGPHPFGAPGISGKAVTGLTPERQVVATKKTQNLVEKLNAAGQEFRPHSPEVVRLAKSLAHTANHTDLDYYDTQQGHGSELMTKAYVMHATGTHDDPSKLESYLGGKELESARRLSYAYEVLQNKERNNKMKTWEPNLTTDYFKSRSGQYVPMSNTDHPEHPLANGGVMEGGETAFKGFYRHPKTGLFTRVQSDGQDIHNGWHPYPRIHPQTGVKMRVFENYSIPEKAIHDADILTETIKHGTTTADIMRKLKGGKEAPIDIQGQAVNLAPLAPIKGVRQSKASSKSREDHAQTTDDFISQGAVAAEEARRNEIKQRAAKAGVGNLPSATVEKTPKGAPKANRGVGRRKVGTDISQAEVEEFTPVERMNKESVSGKDDSKNLITGQEAPEETTPIVERIKKGPTGESRPKEVKNLKMIPTLPPAISGKNQKELDAKRAARGEK